ncbi:hypothetical protein ABZ804_21790 [Streptomyces sp. NPDC047726]|uniref:hypothetical protein n=1 Tax=unclassified Streptomyces TaxID=2593676 RepID=UPI0034084BC7
MRYLRFLTRAPKPAVILTSGAAVLTLGLLGTLGAPAATPDSSTPRADRSTGITVTGDDNADGRVEEDESGWDCHTMGNRVCGPDTPGEGKVIAAPIECEGNDGPLDVYRLCLTVAAQPAYGWTNPDGSKVGIPAGPALISGLDEEPGTAAWSDALRALDAEYREHAPRG